MVMNMERHTKHAVGRGTHPQKVQYRLPEKAETLLTFAPQDRPPSPNDAKSEVPVACAVYVR